MKKAIAGIALTLISTASFARPPDLEITAPDVKISGAPVAPDPLPVKPYVAPLPPNCLPYNAMVEKLENKYGEYPIFSGITKGGRSLRETFINAQTGSYTDLVITPKKSELIACIVGAGDSGVLHDALKPHAI